MKKFKFAPTDEMQKAMSWCFKNGIKQYVVPRKNEFWIVLDHNGKKRKSPNAYKKIDEAHQKIWEIYLYFYKKHKG